MYGDIFHIFRRNGLSIHVNFVPTGVLFCNFDTFFELSSKISLENNKNHTLFHKKKSHTRPDCPGDFFYRQNFLKRGKNQNLIQFRINPQMNSIQSP